MAVFSAQMVIDRPASSTVDRFQPVFVEHLIFAGDADPYSSASNLWCDKQNIWLKTRFTHFYYFLKNWLNICFPNGTYIIFTKESGKSIHFMRCDQTVQYVSNAINPWSTELFKKKSQPKVFFPIWNHHKCLS